MAPRGDDPIIDERLKTWATPRQKEYIDAVNLHGGYRAAARVLGTSTNPFDHTNIIKSIQALKRQAALRGYSPEHGLTRTVPDPFMLKGTSTYYSRDKKTGVVQLKGQWVKTKLDDDKLQEWIRDSARAIVSDMDRLPALPAPAATDHRLLNQYTITDAHVGMFAWAGEGGADWNLEIAERTLLGCFELMVARAPAAHTALICQLGDFVHFDGLDAVTPLHKHQLDASGRRRQIVKVAVRLLRRMIDLALLKHEEVRVIIGEGNHDIDTSIALVEIISAAYENEPRLKVNDSNLPYYVEEWGKTMLAFHHGHIKKMDDLPGLFAAQHHEMWGRTTKRYCSVGHAHFEQLKERFGMKVIQHPTLSARDAYAARGGWVSERQATAMTFDREFGKVGETVVTPEMLESPEA